MNDLFSDISEFETRLKLPRGFYEQLLREDDWSFVIKLSALFEAACTHTLSVCLHAPKIESALAHLEQGNTRCGKIVLLKKLDAINSEQAAILSALAKLRNELAHNIANAGFKFNEYIADLNKDNKNNFVKWFGHGLRERVTIGSKSSKRRDFVLSNAKLAIWLTAAEVLACLYLDIENTEISIQSEALQWYKNLTSKATGRSDAAPVL